MSTFSLDNNKATYQIRGFQPGQIRVNDNIYTQSLIISAHQCIENWPPVDAHDITHAHLAKALALKPDILLIGTGLTQQFLSLDVYGEFLNHGIGVEIMDTSAACRTFSALTSENRNVVAAVVLR